MKVRKKSATFLFGVIFLGLSSSMVLGATDVLGDVGSQAIQLGNKDGSASQNGLGSDNGNATKDNLESQVNKEDGNDPQFAFIGNDNGNSRASRDNVKKTVIGGTVFTMLALPIGAGVYFTKKKDASGSEEKITEEQTGQQNDIQIPDSQNDVEPDKENNSEKKKSMSTGLIVLIIAAAIIALNVLVFLGMKYSSCFRDCMIKMHSI